jgi:hypothetical protein
LTKFHRIVQYRLVRLLLYRQNDSTIAPLGRRRSTGHNLPPCLLLQDVIMTFLQFYVISNLQNSTLFKDA